MKHSDFVHLHVHTHFSLLDSSLRHEDLFKRAAEFKMPAVAMTDHSNLFGALEFFQGAKKHGLKPIIGCEVYVAPESRLKKEKDANHQLRDASYHLLLLAKNDRGYKNLLELVTRAYLEGFYYKPRIDKELLASNADGLIALSCCNRGEIAHNLGKENLPRATKVAQQYMEIMGPDNFYLELQDHGQDWQKKINRELITLGKNLNLPLVATNNCHYLEKSDFRAHEILLCLQTGKTMDDQYRMRYPSDEYYFKSPEEMKEVFKDVPEAIENTIKIAERCNVEIETGIDNLPEYPVPEGYTLHTYLIEISRKGLEERFSEFKALGLEFDKKPYEERLEEELHIIEKMGYPGYFLIVWDFIHYAKVNDIPVGPGRGSAAGSLVAYCLRITDLDPMQYDLLFERFLNPERVSMPDIDIDFCIHGREKVIEYVSKKYGGNQFVTQIITFGSMNAKGVLRDVGRVLGMPYGDVDKIAKLVPNKLNITLAEAFKEESKFKSMRKENKQVDELLDIAVSLEGLPRHCSTHAAGVVISPKPLTEFCALYKGGNDEITTQFSMNNIEKLGLLKMDFLGLRTLTVIDNALKLLKSSTGLDLDINAIRKDDAETFKLLGEGRTLGVFQLESSGMRDLLVKMKPDCFEDIIALLALYRPGPLESGMIDDYVKRKHGTMEEKYDLPQLEAILKETHGVILYQEQVMKIANVLAGFTLGDADLLRRAMGKKKPEEMARQREKFMEGSHSNKVPEKKAKKIFDLMEKFAGYGFNKSHSAAYALISYQTAYLKAHHPLPFFGALITSEMDNTDKVIRYFNDCRESDINILPPDVNEGQCDFSISGDKLLFGLGAIKNVGAKAIDSIIETREELGRFNSIKQFCENVDLGQVNRRVIESLIKSGACDSFEESRAVMVKNLQVYMDLGQARQRDREMGQSSLFDGIQESESDLMSASIKKVEDWSERDRLKYEKETLGFYVSGHPLNRFQRDMAWFSNATTASIAESSNGAKVTLAGIPARVITKVTRKGDKMGLVTLEDLQGTVELTVWPDIYERCATLLEDDQPILVKGKVESGDVQGTKVIVDEIFLLEDYKNHFQGKVSIDIRTLGLESSTLKSLHEVLAHHRGQNQVKVRFIFPDQDQHTRTLLMDLTVNPTDDLIAQVEEVVGKGAIRFE
ncbi:MAG: DNA polymerase III subunit alpha [Candidatus Nitronauta litoralis]|uniref:DNA polymerase III subunit alpha n=1 Tax=Candidatus Nitronauta litoralis TaxID=2705533 RepID=A0A7T0BXX1_9BACT|nr:MAG: DNA polymerase III subunit alpha [Candidatus Nitronauta litoralis]